MLHDSAIPGKQPLPQTVFCNCQSQGASSQACRDRIGSQCLHMTLPAVAVLCSNDVRESLWAALGGTQVNLKEPVLAGRATWDVLGGPVNKAVLPKCPHRLRTSKALHCIKVGILHGCADCICRGATCALPAADLSTVHSAAASNLNAFGHMCIQQSGSAWQGQMVARRAGQTICKGSRQVLGSTALLLAGTINNCT